MRPSTRIWKASAIESSQERLRPRRGGLFRAACPTQLTDLAQLWWWRRGRV